MVGVYLWGGWQEKIVLAPSFIAIGTALLLIGSECTLPPVLRFLTGPAPVLSSFGRRSYEIYLFHLVVIESMWIVSADLKFNLAVYSPLWLFAFLCVAYGVAYLIFRFWSEPMNHFIRPDRFRTCVLFRGSDGQTLYNPRFRNYCGKGKFITFIIVNYHRRFACNFYFVLRIPASAAKSREHDISDFV